MLLSSEAKSCRMLSSEPEQRINKTSPLLKTANDSTPSFDSLSRYWQLLLAPERSTDIISMPEMPPILPTAATAAAAADAATAADAANAAAANAEEQEEEEKLQITRKKIGRWLWQKETDDFGFVYSSFFDHLFVFI